MTVPRRAALLASLACTGALLLPASASGARWIGFDDAFPGSEITDNYKDQGIYFGDGPGVAFPRGNPPAACGAPTAQENPGAAASPPNVAKAPTCSQRAGDVSFPVSGTMVGLAEPTRSLSVLAGTGAGGGTEGQITAYDGDGEVIAESKAPIGGAAGGVLAVSDSRPRIRWVRISARGQNLILDELSFAEPGDKPAQAGFGFQQAPGRRAVLDASGSEVPGSSVESYEWDLNSDGKAEVRCDGVAPQLVVRAKSAGTLNVKLTATDATGAKSTASQQVSVGAGAGAARAAGPAKVDPVHFCGSDDPKADVTGGGGPPPGCADAVSVAFVQAKGCFREPLRVQDLPKRERELVDSECFKKEIEEAQARVQNIMTKGAREAAELVKRDCDRSRLPFKSLTDLAASRVFVSLQTIRLNGLDIVPKNGATVLLMPGDDYIVSADAEIRVGDVTLRSGAIALGPFGNTTLEAAGKGRYRVGDIDIAGLPPLPGGLSMSGAANLDLTAAGAEVNVNLELPKLLRDPVSNQALTASTTFTVNNDRGFELEKLDVKVPRALLGAMVLKDVYFRYNRTDDLFEGGGNANFPPGGGIGAELAIQNGGLKRLHVRFAFPDPGLHLAFGVFMNEVDAGLAFNPLVIRGGVAFTAGGSYAGFKLVGIRGDMTLTTEPVAVRVDGRLTLAGIPLANGFFRAGMDGEVRFGGQFKLDLFDAFVAEAAINARIVADGRWQADANARLCIGDFACAKGEVVLSNVGFGGCVRVDIELLVTELKLAAGAGYRWGDRFPDFFFSCNLTGYKAFASGARAAQQARSFTVRRGTKLQAVAFTGRGAPPDVILRGPKGQVVDIPKQGALKQRGLIAYHVAPANTTFVQMAKPAAGRWRVEEKPGSAPITTARVATGYAPRVRARVAGRDDRRRLAYRVEGISAGDKVTFEERGGEMARRIGVARGRRGSISFRPGPGRAERRRVVATITRGGMPVRSLPVASYRSPRQRRLAAPRRVRVTRGARGRTIVVRWGGVGGAHGYLVATRLTDGRRVALPVGSKARRLVLGNAIPRSRGSITVAAVDAADRAGQSRRATVERAKPKRRA